MDFLWFSLVGLLSGIFAGMGMGGGTFLIPLLTIILGVSQKVAQGVNLVVFIPLAFVCLIIYFKKGYIKLKGVFWLYIPAIIFSAGGAFFAGKIDGQILRIIFGAFLVLFGIFWLILTIISKMQKKNKQQKN